jgi:zinc/manganese transport system substrate-binding protein
MPPCAAAPRTRRPHGVPHRLSGILITSVALALLAPPVVAQDEDVAPAPTIVATTEMLGWVVSRLAPTDARLIVLMKGVDPHAWEPSARDIEQLVEADLVVANGLGLEAPLDDAIREAGAQGTPIFTASDHITVRAAGADEHDPDDPDHDEHTAGDPHLWLDPLAMRDVVRALAPALEGSGMAVGGRADGLAADLQLLDYEARAILDAVPSEDRRLVTGHESMGYFADRYGFTLIGALIPGLSSQGEVSAGELAELVETIRREDVPAIFVERGTPRRVVDAVAEETGAKVVELALEQLPADGSYETFIRRIAQSVADALAR